MKIRTGYQIVIMTAAQYSVKTVNAARHDMDKCSGDYEVVSITKQQSRNSDYVHTPEISQQLQVQFIWLCEAAM